jgi:O-antigen ligase/Tfp pilus assembly protein PilF
MILRFQQILLFLLLVWVPVAFFNRAADGFTLTKELVAILTIIFCGIKVIWERRAILRLPLVQVALGFVLWMVLDSLWVGSLKMEVFKGSIHLFLIVGTLLAVVFACSRGSSYEKLVRYVLFTGAFIALYGIFQRIGLDRANWNNRFESRAFSTLGNPDYLGGYLAALLPLAFIQTLRASGRKDGWLWLNITLVLTAGLFATRVRGAELAALSAFLFLGASFFTHWGRQLAGRNRLLLSIVLGLFLFGTATLAVLQLNFFNRSQASIRQRLETYRVAWEMVKDHPWLGIGLGHLGIQFPRYQARPWPPADYPLHPYTYSEHVHNEFLQFWVEGGLPGLLLFLALLWAFVLALRKFLKDTSSKETDKELILGVLGGVIALLVQSLSNFPFQVAPTAVLFGFLLAAPLSLSTVSSQKPTAPAALAQNIFLALAMFIAAAAGLRTMGSSIAFRDTVGEASQGNGKLAAYYGARLVSLSPSNPKAWNAYGKALETAGLPDPAFQAYQKAIELNPNYAESLVPMAQIRLNQSRFEEAFALCQQAESITPNYALPLWPMSVSLFELKRFDEAARGFEKFLAYVPNDFQTYLNLGVCYIQLKRKAEAIEAWKKAYALNPTDPQVVRYLKSQGVNLN